MICDPGDVVVVPFPFVDSADEKRRPALVLSSATFNSDNRHSVLAMITTAARSSWPSDIAIAGWAAAGLARACVVRWKVFTLPNALILRKAGRLREEERGAMLAAARRLVGG